MSCSIKPRQQTPGLSMLRSRRNQPLETPLLNSLNAKGATTGWNRVISEGGHHGYM
jgi:hypothetical protein